MTTSASTRPNLDHVRQALAIPDFDVENAWMFMVPRPRVMQRPQELDGTPRAASVLLLLYPRGDDLAFLLTRRTDHLSKHKGQISLPGGAQEPDETPRQAALREACEELSICAIEDEVDMVGTLSELYLSVSDFQITPFVGYLPDAPDFTPDPSEVAEVIEMTLTQLIDDSIKYLEHWTIQEFELDVPFYEVNGHTVWGATAIMLSEFETRLRSVLGMALPEIEKLGPREVSA